MIVEDILQRLVAERERRNLSQNKFAKLMGMTQGAWRQIEIGRTRLTVEAVEKAAEVLEISVADLMGFQTSETTYVLPPEAVQEIADRLKDELTGEIVDRLFERLYQGRESKRLESDDHESG